MRNLTPRVRWGAFLLLIGLACAMLAGLALGDVNTICTPSQNKIKVKWLFPCSGPPKEKGQEEAVTRGNPPNDPPAELCFTSGHTQSDNVDNRVVGVGCCYANGDEASGVFTRGCATAGGNAIRANGATTGSPFAAVGLLSTVDDIPPDSMMRVHVDRIVTPGPVPDIVTVTFLGGGLQTGVVTAGDQAQAILKLIVYPDTSTAFADTELSGAGSAFFGEITLDGITGSLAALNGFAVGDFPVQNNGSGVFTARPAPALVKVALVPDANAAAVSMVGDPSTYSQGTVGVGGNAPNLLRLAPAMPNPFGGNVALGFSLPQSGPVSLEVFDLLGRRVRSWHWDNLPAGEHSVSWDGRTDAGARIGAGTLLLRLTAMGKAITQKAVLMR